jgi:protocatechuate 3,4-dioxygenase beta subunit
MIIGRHIVVAIAIACGAAVAAAPQAQQQGRGTARATPGTASISGTVYVDGETKRPARRVRVTLTNVARSSPGQTTTTDDSGGFAFRGLPAGRFELQAFKNAYLRASFGAARPDRAGTPVVVSDGETIRNLTMTIARGGVITGVVRDMRGRPVPGVSVRVLKLGYNAVTGERTLSAPSTGSASMTDDRGEYRAYGLPPGGYLVLLTPTPPSGRGNDGIRQLTRDEVQQALQAARSGAPTAAAPRPPLTPSAVTTSATRVNYAPVFHPGATDIRAAATIPLGLSEERAGVDIPMQLVPTATISGTISASSSTLPQFLSVGLVPAGAQTEMLNGAGLRGLSIQPGAGGTYTFTGVAPGTYTIKAIVGSGGARGAPPNAPTQWAAAEVNVNGQDLEIPLTLQPGVAINGRVVFEGSRPTAAELQTLSFALMPPGSGGRVLYGGGGRVDAEGRFTFAGVTPDVYQFTTTWTAAGALDKWTIKTSTANGRESFEAPLRVNPNETVEWTVTYTDKPTTLTGVLQDNGGRAATDYYILVFSSDRRHWTPGSRRVRMTRPATDGSYIVKGLPPGEYFLAAPTDLETGEWNDPMLLEQLVGSSAKVSLRDGETTTQAFRVGGA